MSTEPGSSGRVRKGISLAVKRAFDVASSSAVALAVAPAFPLLAFCVKWRSRGPLFFTQERVGVDQRPFRMIKFRTMSQPPPGHDPTKWNVAEESRISPLGRFLRDFGLDELPQVINIIKGDMSVIGPRPPLPAQVEQYSDEQRKMFGMKPGVLSLAAIRGRRAIDMEKRIELHVEYVERWSLALDIEILLKSLFVVLRRMNADEKVDQP